MQALSAIRWDWGPLNNAMIRALGGAVDLKAIMFGLEKVYENPHGASQFNQPPCRWPNHWIVVNAIRNLLIHDSVD